jgi:uncharacterized membrane protein YhaH (DUF805 family)
MNQEHRHVFIFARYFLRYAFVVRHILAALFLLLVLGGVAIAYLEDLPLADSIYFAFITGLTIGYGDIKPVTAWGRVASVVIGFIGLIFTGMTIAIATRALHDTVKDLREK